MYILSIQYYYVNTIAFKLKVMNCENNNKPKSLKNDHGDMPFKIFSFADCGI